MNTTLALPPLAPKNESGHRQRPTPEQAVGSSVSRAQISRARWAARAGALIAVVCVSVFLIGFVVFADRIANFQTPSVTSRADAIVVLTGGHYRLSAAVDLLEQHRADRLLISGVNPETPPESVRRAAGADPYLFNCCVDLDTRAMDTIGNAEEAALWLRQRGYNDVILVTNNYHMPRSLLEFQRQAPAIKLQPYPVVNSDLADGRWLRDPDALRVLFTEYLKYLAANIRPWRADDTVDPSRQAAIF